MKSYFKRFCFRNKRKKRRFIPTRFQTYFPGECRTFYNLYAREITCTRYLYERRLKPRGLVEKELYLFFILFYSKGSFFYVIHVFYCKFCQRKIHGWNLHNHVRVRTNKFVYVCFCFLFPIRIPNVCIKTFLRLFPEIRENR